MATSAQRSGDNGGPATASPRRPTVSPSTAPHSIDVVIIGAGAAGLFCAAQAVQLELKILLIDNATKV